MENWTIQTILYGSCTITVRRPVMSGDERVKREREITATLERILGSHLKKCERGITNEYA